MTNRNENYPFRWLNRLRKRNLPELVAVPTKKKKKKVTKTVTKEIKQEVIKVEEKPSPASLLSSVRQEPQSGLLTNSGFDVARNRWVYLQKKTPSKSSPSPIRRSSTPTFSSAAFVELQRRHRNSIGTVTTSRGMSNIDRWSSRSSHSSDFDNDDCKPIRVTQSTHLSPKSSLPKTDNVKQTVRRRMIEHMIESVDAELDGLVYENQVKSLVKDKTKPIKKKSHRRLQF